MTSADRDFLLKTSLTGMVNSELADQLTGRSDSRRVLEGLFESGVFTVDSDRIGVEHRPPDRERSGPIYLLEEEHTALVVLKDSNNWPGVSASKWLPNASHSTAIFPA